MALTVTKKWLSKDRGPEDPGGDRIRMMVVSIDFDNSYPTGGEALDLSGDFPILLGVFTDGGKAGYVPQYDYANKKILMYEAGADAAALDEVADTTDLSAITGVKLLAIGY